MTLNNQYVAICTSQSATFSVVLLWRLSYRLAAIGYVYYGAVLPRRRPHHVLILSVCLSVCLSRAST